MSFDNDLLHATGLLLRYYPRLTPIRLKAALDTCLAAGDTVSLPVAAASLGCSEPTLWRAINKGWLPAYKIGKRWRLPMASLELYRQSRANSPVPVAGDRRADGELDPSAHSFTGELQ